jgi:hypothetical protein
MAPQVARAVRDATVLQALRRVPTFAHVTRAMLRPLQGQFLDRVFDAGCQLTAVGQPVDGLHVLTVRQLHTHITAESVATP